MTHAEIVGKFLSTLPEDDDHPYRTGPWRPQTCEWDSDDLTVVAGELPADLDGVYLRNTENPLHPALKNYHPFDGDGMLHIVGFRDGKAFYRNRFVKTDGFLAENAAFAEACADNDLKFIGPSAEVIRTMGDKARARETARRFGVPVVPGSEGAFASADEAAQAAKDIGFPLLLKARAGGGGRGMRIANDMAGFSEAFAQASRESEAAFGDGAIYLERFLPRVRHIEVQVLGDGRGNSLQMDERDCSIQRRHQKLVEESPSPVVDAALRARLLDVSGCLTRGLAYEGAGTVEFIFDETSGEFFFIEMNTRIQVEHPVTEMRTGLDLVEAQFKIAQGHPLPSLDENTMPGGHAIEFRINAEDWLRGFVPSPGRLDEWQPPQGLGVRFDSAVDQGHSITPYYDSMIGKLIIHGRDREEALARARVALSDFRCEGVASTIGFHRILVDDEDFLDNRVYTRWAETVLPEPSG